MSHIYYLAYGSNLHPHRLKVRVPSSQFLGVAELEGHRIAFHKRGACGSGKCNLLRADESGASAFGAIYQMHADEKVILDKFEGEGYRTEEIVVSLDGESLTSFAYIAEDSHIDDALQPYHWYRDIIYHGGRYHGLPEYYLEAIATTDSIQDPDPDRMQQSEELLLQIQSYSL